MSEAYKVVYSIEKNLYIQGSPVIIIGGGLIRDIKRGSMFCQVSLVNISSKTIKSVSCDAVTDLGVYSGGADDLFCSRDMDITINIPLAGYDHKSIQFEITDIEFTDSAHWCPAKDGVWEKLNGAPTVEEYFQDKDIISEFKNKYDEAIYSPTEDKDLWYCCCGALNHSDEAVCHKCNKSLAKMKKYIEEDLVRNVQKQKRLDAISKQKFDEAYNNVLLEKKSKRNRTFLYILIAVAIITVIALLIATDRTHYTQAI